MTSEIERKLAKQIMVEQRYLSLKGFLDYRKGLFRKSPLNGKSLRRYVTVNYAVSVVSFTFISIAIFFFKTLGNYSVASISNITFLAIVYSFFISGYNSLLLFNSIMDNRLLKPLEIAPQSKNTRILLLCFLIYYGSASLSISAPVFILDSIYLGSLSFLPSAIVWSVSMIFLGQIFGFGIGLITSRSRKAAVSFSMTVFTLAKLLVIIAAFSLLELILFEPGSINFSIPDFGFKSYFLYLLGIPYILFFSGNSLLSAIDGFIVSLVYLAVSVFAAYRITRRAARRLVEETVYSSAGVVENKPFSRKGIFRTLLSKDVLFTLRNSYNAMLLVIPALVTVPIIVPYVGGDYAGANPLGVMLTLLSLSAICASFFAFMSLLAESEGINVLKTVPVTIKRMINSKFIFGSAVFLPFMIPASFAALYFISSGWIYFLLVPAALFLAFSYSMMINLRRFFLKIPPEATRITPDSFGGNIGLMYTFFTTFILNLLPSLVGFQIYSSVYVPLFAPNSPPSYLQEMLLVLFIEFIVLVLVLLVINKEKRLSRTL